MTKYLFLILLFILGGCNFIQKSTPTEKGCGDKPPPELVLKNPQAVTLTRSLKDIGEGQISSLDTVGYTFKGKSGQKLEYSLKTPEEACLWIIAPSNQVFTGKTLSETGTYIVQLAGLKGQKQTYSLSMGLDVESAAASSPIVEKSPRPSPTPETPSDGLSQADAVELIKKWYDAKNSIFGTTYNESLADKYTTGTLLYETVTKCNDGVCGGSVGWLKEYGCYYTYDNSQIKEIVSFSSSGDSATLVINVRETLELHGSKSAGCGKNPQTYQKNVTYYLKKVAGNWKISKYEVGA